MGLLKTHGIFIGRTKDGKKEGAIWRETEMGKRRDKAIKVMCKEVTGQHICPDMFCATSPGVL